MSEKDFIGRIDPRYMERFKITRDHAEHIQRMQARNWHKIITPAHPRFQELYGATLDRQRKAHDKQVRIAQDLQAETKERKNHAKTKQ